MIQRWFTMLLGSGVFHFTSGEKETFACSLTSVFHDQVLTANKQTRISTVTNWNKQNEAEEVADKTEEIGRCLTVQIFK